LRHCCTAMQTATSRRHRPQSTDWPQGRPIAGSSCTNYHFCGCVRCSPVPTGMKPPTAVIGIATARWRHRLARTFIEQRHQSGRLSPGVGRAHRRSLGKPAGLASWQVVWSGWPRSLWCSSCCPTHWVAVWTGRRRGHRGCVSRSARRSSRSGSGRGSLATARRTCTGVGAAAQ